MWSRIIAILLLLQIANACDTDGEIRLAGGSNEFEGRVEVCNNSVWNTVCDDNWGAEEAAVVCRQLGRFNGSQLIPERNPNVFGRGTGSIIRVRWECIGTETNLLQCQMDMTSLRCDHKRDGIAGVFCYDTDNCSDGDIRLVDDDEDGGRGRVEVCLDGYWGTVCDNGWDSNDATTVCRQLGYNDTNNTGIPTERAFFGEGSGPIHWTRLQCKNDDTRLIDCDKETTAIDNCDHGEDAGVICKGISNCEDGEVRLVGGENEREGRVEICFSHVWGTVCDHGWDEVDANVVCNQLRYGISVTATFSLGAGDGPILLNNVACNTSHLELAQCVPKKEIGIHNCDRTSTAGVICSDPGGNSPATNNFNDTTSSIPTEQTAPLSAILGPLGGALLAGIIVAMVIASIVVLKRRKIQKGSMDNPTYDEAIRIHVELPTGNSDLNMNHPHLKISPKLELAEYQGYQGLSANTMLDEALYESIRSSLLPGTVGNEEEEETSKGNESEVVYDVPPIEDDYDEICDSIEEATKASYSEY